MTTVVMVVGTVVPITVWFPLAYNYSIPDTSSHLILTTTCGQTFIPLVTNEELVIQWLQRQNPQPLSEYRSLHSFSDDRCLRSFFFFMYFLTIFCVPGTMLGA